MPFFYTDSGLYNDSDLNGNKFLITKNNSTKEYINFIFSKHGEILEIFIVDNIGSGIKYSPWGDIYWYKMVREGNNVTAFDFYRVKNVWDPILTQ